MCMKRSITTDDNDTFYTELNDEVCQYWLCAVRETPTHNSESEKPRVQVWSSDSAVWWLLCFLSVLKNTLGNASNHNIPWTCTSSVLSEIRMFCVVPKRFSDVSHKSPNLAPDISPCDFSFLPLYLQITWSVTYLWRFESRWQLH